jgi:hypothetical protein
MPCVGDRLGPCIVIVDIAGYQEGTWNESGKAIDGEVNGARDCPKVAK